MYANETNFIRNAILCLITKIIIHGNREGVNIIMIPCRLLRHHLTLTNDRTEDESSPCFAAP